MPDIVLIVEGVSAELDAPRLEEAANAVLGPDVVESTPIVLATCDDGTVRAVKLPGILDVRVQDGASFRLARLGDVIGRSELL